MHDFEVPQVAREMAWDRYGFVREAEVRDTTEPIDDDDLDAGPVAVRRVLARIGDHDHLFRFAQLSGRERSQVIVSGAMVIASWQRDRPTLLFVDIGAQLLPDELLAEYLERLSRPEFTFQTVLLSPTERPKLNWTGWSVVRLADRPPKTTVKQDRVS